MLSPHLSDHLLPSHPLCLTTWMMGPKLLQGKMFALFSQMRESITCLIVRFFALTWFHSMSGELGSYTIVVGNEGDRNDLALWFKGGSLVSIWSLLSRQSINLLQIERVASVCDNTIAVVHSVGPVSFSWGNHPNITGIIYAGAPGEQTGPSLVDVLYGTYNPRERLPFSISDVSRFYNQV